MLLFGKYILIVIVAVLMLCVLSYISVPVYDFQSGRSFCGDSVYNPYAGADSSCWRKANFHAHQKEKPQCDYTVEQMLEAYRSNGYDIMSISDHQCLNTEHADRPGFIPTYEHGYGINGYHQLVMGAERVTWRDFPLMLTQLQMQYMLHWLRPQAEALVLNHPGKTRIIDLAVYGWLRGYDLLEINPERGRERSEQYWDTALSAGIYSTLIGDDDAHNIRNRSSWFQRCFTMVNTPSLRPGDIMKSLKKGAAYAVYVPHDVNNRPDPHGDLPRMERISMQGDTIRIRVDRPASAIRFIGQNGTLLAEGSGAEAVYAFRKNDAYARAEAHFDDGTILFFNPFVRTADGNRPVNVFVPVVNYPLTVLCHLLWFALLAGLTALMLYLSGVRRGSLYYRWNPSVAPERTKPDRRETTAGS